MCCFTRVVRPVNGSEGIDIMRSQKHPQICEPQALMDIESRLVLDSVGCECALTKTADSESWVWIVLDLIIDSPKLALMSLLTSIAAGFGREGQHHCSDE